MFRTMYSGSWPAWSEYFQSKRIWCAKENVLKDGEAGQFDLHV